MITASDIAGKDFKQELFSCVPEGLTEDHGYIKLLSKFSVNEACDKVEHEFAFEKGGALFNGFKHTLTIKPNTERVNEFVKSSLAVMHNAPETKEVLDKVEQALEGQAVELRKLVDSLITNTGLYSLHKQEFEGGSAYLEIALLQSSDPAHGASFALVTQGADGAKAVARAETFKEVESAFSQILDMA
ncbi:hypothetical protein [Vibrio crassostreae]|uniref:hypothetical protein n=1 Tax=Vibrio crassostreae TaxID=246167 RepID=UPI001B30AD49|nr:hypothetical protein [Vibrio crassostreae]